MFLHRKRGDMKKILYGLIFIMLVLSGCQSTKTIPQYSLSASYDINTINQSLNIDYSVNFDNYKTFSIIDPPNSAGANQLEGLAGGPMKFMLSEFLETRGYRPVDGDEAPDMIVAMSGRVNTESQRIAGHSGVLPIWRPSKTYTYNSYSTGRFNAYSSFGNTYSGNLTGSTYGSTNVPGGLEYMPYSVQDQIVQKNFAQLLVTFFDAKSNKEIAIAKSSANTFSSDPVLACYSLTSSLNEFPPNIEQLKEGRKTNKWKGYAGFVAYPFPINGMIYPRVVNVAPQSAASSSGLRAHDIIISLNGIGTKNTPLVKFFREMEISPGDILTMFVWRGDDNYKTLKIKTTNRPNR